MLAILYLSGLNLVLSDLPTDEPLQVAFDPASYTVFEGDQVNLTIVKTGTADIPAILTLSTAGVTATGS